MSKRAAIAAFHFHSPEVKVHCSGMQVETKIEIRVCNILAGKQSVKGLPLNHFSQGRE